MRDETIFWVGKIGAHIFIIREGSDPQGNRGPVAVGFTEASRCVSVKWKQTHLRGGRFDAHSFM